MGIQSSRSSSKKRVFVNYPLRRGMQYGNIITSEGVCKASVNYDRSSSGEEGYPRPAFVNAILHNGSNSVFMPEHLIKMTTNIGPTFLIGAYSTVNRTEYNSEDTSVTLPDVPYESPFNLKFINLGSQTTQLTNDASLVKVHVSSLGVVDGDTVWVYNDGDSDIEGQRYKVRLIGLDAQEITDLNYRGNYISGHWDVGDVCTYISENRDYKCIQEFTGDHLPADTDYWEPFYGFEAKEYLTTYMATYNDYYLLFDEFSQEEDEWDYTDGETYHSGRKLAYVFGHNTGEVYRLINGILIQKGYAYLAYIDNHYKYYSNLRELYDYAILHSYRIHGDYTGTDPGDWITVLTEYAYFEDGSITDDASSGLVYFKQKVSTNVTVNSTIYTSKSFFEETPTEADLDLSGEDVTIQFLVHDYETQEYEFTQKSKEVPNANMPWRNAISFFGRIIENDTVRYKGLITLQYGRLSAEDNLEMFILVQEPYEVNLATFNNEDPYSIAYNALDDDPYIFIDYTGTDASAWVRPTLLGMVIYKRTKTGLKVATKVNQSGEYYVKPYWALPNVTATGFLGCSLRLLIDNEPVLLDTDEDGWTSILTSGNSFVTGIAGKLEDEFKFHNSNGKPIVAELRTEIYNETITRTTASGSFAFCTTDLNYDKSAMENADEVKEFTVAIALFNNVSLSGATMFQDRIKITLTDTTTGDSFEQMFYGTTEEDSTHLTFANGQDLDIVLGKYTYTLSIVDNSLINDNDVREEVWSTDIEHEIWLSRVSSHPLIVQEEELIDSQDLLSEHNVWNATQIAILDRFLILYGEDMGSHSLQFLEFDTTDFAPFPYGQIVFDAEIRHVHAHQGVLYIFCTDGLWLLHSGLSYKEMIKTFAYSGVNLTQAEKKSVVSYGNEVFFMHNNKGYVVRTNQYIQSKEDIYVMEMTQAVNYILGSPNKFVQERLQNSYEIVVDDTSTLSVNYFSKVVNSELHIIASYHIKDPIDVLMVTLIYDKDTKSWRVYDTVAGSFPLYTVNSANMKGYDLILANRYDDGFITYGTYLYELPNADEIGQRLGDARSVVYLNDTWELADADAQVSNALIPIQTMLDSGSLDLSSLNKKRVRQYMFKFSNPNAVEFIYRVIPFMDGIPYSNAVSVDALIDEYGNVIESLLQIEDVDELERTEVKFITFNELGGTSLIETKFTTLSKFEVRLNTNLVGYSPGFQLYIPAKDTFHLNQYGIRYRQFGTR